MREETPTLLGLLERANLNHWTIPDDGQSPKPVNSECYTSSWEPYRIYPICLFPFCFAFSLHQKTLRMNSWYGFFEWAILSSGICCKAAHILRKHIAFGIGNFQQTIRCHPRRPFLTTVLRTEILHSVLWMIHFLCLFMDCQFNEVVVIYSRIQRITAGKLNLVHM
jgi:hypothetical protein